MQVSKNLGLIFVGISVITVMLYMKINGGSEPPQVNFMDISRATPDSNAKLTRGNSKQVLVAMDIDPNSNIDSEVAVDLLRNYFDTVVNDGSITAREEEMLLNYLRENDDQIIYQLIIDRLGSLGLESIDSERMYEYTLSFLAAVNSYKASELFYSTITTNDISGSHAIYSANKSIERLSRNPEYTQLAQDAFSDSKDTSVFLVAIAKSIAVNAEADNVEFLLSFVESGNKEKQYAAQTAMKSLSKESLVPLLQEKITDENHVNVQDSALESLAHMGQYEAGVALLKWAAQQPNSELDKVTTLFNVAIARSPSTKRAIDKEIKYIDFVSQDIKDKVIELKQLKNQLELSN